MCFLHYAGPLRAHFLLEQMRTKISFCTLYLRTLTWIVSVLLLLSIELLCSNVMSDSSPLTDDTEYLYKNMVLILCKN